MIREVEIVDPARAHLSWVPRVPSLGAGRRFVLAPGLNVVWGRNGSGKSTFLRLLGDLLHCRQGGFTRVTLGSLRALHVAVGDPLSPYGAVRVDHDGQPALYFDASTAVGLSGGAFDDDFFLDGVRSAVFTGSSGQTTDMRMRSTLRAAISGEIPTSPRDLREDAPHLNSYWRSRIDVAATHLRGADPPGPLTVFMDEPDRSLDVTAQRVLWRVLRALAERRQLVVATHSPLALRLPEASYVELTGGGYLGECEAIVAGLPAWPDERPRIRWPETADGAALPEEAP